MIVVLGVFGRSAGIAMTQPKLFYVFSEHAKDLKEGTSEASADSTDDSVVDMSA